MSILFVIFIVLVVASVGVNVFAYFYEKQYKKKLETLASKGIEVEELEKQK